VNRIEGKNIIITGASAGIGKACAEKCASYKANLVLLARRIGKLRTFQVELEDKHGISVKVVQVDITDRNAVGRFTDELRDDSIYPDILINNAGMDAGFKKFHEGSFEDWDKMINTNLNGLINISRNIIPMMVEKNKGHVVNIGSIAGYQVYPSGSIYSVTKFGVRALTEAMSVDLLGTDIRISCVSPGLVQTEIMHAAFQNDSRKIEKLYKGFKPLTPDDVAETVLFVINSPEHVNVLEMLVLPTAQRNVYCLHRDGR